MRAARATRYTRLVKWPVAVLLLTVGCWACGARHVRPAPPPEAIAGTWSLLDGSDVQMRVVRPRGGAVTIEAWAAADGSTFEVTAVSFDGRKLRATFRYPKTGVSTTSELQLVGKDRLEGTVSGTYSGRETWVRLE